MARKTLLAFLALAAPSIGHAATAPDYAQPAAWICRPGKETTCTTGLDAMAIAPDGTSTPRNLAPNPNPPIDCFYVYPTVSEEPGPYADMSLTPALIDVARTQAGRLSAYCRLFAPIYRQLTEAGLASVLTARGTPDWSSPYADVLAAWRWYMAHENNGRGVILIGHSQGAILLHKLLREQIDSQPAQQRLVAAFLAGDPSLPVPKNARMGGAFREIPLCHEPAETGCVYVWSSYLAGDDAPARIFGRNPPGANIAGCVNPARPEGGPGALRPYFRKPAGAPAADPPWIVAEGALSAQCVADAQGNVLRVTVLPTKLAPRLRDELRQAAADDPGGWGLHVLDLDLTQGNVLDRVAQETSAWLRQPK